MGHPNRKSVWQCQNGLESVSFLPYNFLLSCHFHEYIIVMYPFLRPAVKCRSAELRMFTRIKCGLIVWIFCCGFMGKMHMRTDSMSDYLLFILQRQAYCLGLKTVRLC